ncbi:MAG: carbohydrate ABC transporter permease [Bacillota bacterium]
MKGYTDKKILPYLLILPSAIILVLFLYWPAIQAFLLSLYRSAPFGGRKIFNGLQNYVKIFNDPAYLRSVWLTALYVVLTIVIGLSISLFLSVLANQKLRGAKIYRVIFFLPYAISPAVAGSLWVFLFNPVAGHINYILNLLFNIQPPWLSDGTLAFIAVVITTIWKNLGFNVIFFLAGLQSIPDTIYEAARIDGASPIDSFWRITIPLLSPTTFYLVIMNIIFTVFQSFGIIDIMTEGGPAGATNMLIYKLYRDSFINFKHGFAASQTVVLLAMVIGVTVLHFKYGSRNVHYQ